MRAHHVKYLLVGGGVASSSAAEAIRLLDPAGSVMLVSQEIVRPYHRPPLSKQFLRRQISREELFTHGQDWFEGHQIELRTGRRAARLDTSRAAVTLDDGEVVSYDKLLLATGMSARRLDVPGAQLPNLYYLRTLEDAFRLQTVIDTARQIGHRKAPPSFPTQRGIAAVIGAGLLGVEVAASLAQVGISVDLLCSQSHPWDRIAGDVFGTVLGGILEDRGIRIHANARPRHLAGDGRVQRIVLEDGRVIDCDFAVAAIGAVVNRELLRGTPIEAETSILTDAGCRTSVSNIYAAGDCAAMFDPLFGKHRMVDHWNYAASAGTLAGRNMAGSAEKYTGVNSFISSVFDLTLKGWGESRLVYRRLVRNIGSSNNGPPDIIEFGIAADGRIAQVLALGHHGDESALAGLVARRAATEGLEEKLKDPSAPLD